MSRAAHVAAVLLAIGSVGYAWGFAQPVPALNDERAYALQAEIFASWRWTAPAAPLPHFFEQLYVFSTPFTAGKYWPGHPLVLSLGWMTGWPTLTPLLLNALTTALLFSLVRREHGVGVAMLACLLWCTDAATLVLRASFLSHVTTVACTVSAAWCLQQRRLGGSRWWLLAGWAALCWVAIARPLTGAAVALPWVVTAWRAERTVHPRHLALAAMVGALVFALIPLWSVKTTGSWTETPYARYAREYFPYDKIGFGFDPTPPTRELPPDFAAYYRSLGAYFQAHTVERLPAIAWERVGAVARDLGREWPIPFWPIAVLGVVMGWRSSPALRLGVWSALALFALHLTFAHPAWWIAYYSEAFPWFFWAVAVAASRAFMAACEFARVAPRTRVALAAVAGVWAAVMCVPGLRAARAEREVWERQPRMVERAAEQVTKPAILFVRYETGANSAFKVTRAEADWSNAAVWVVYGRGADNDALWRLDPSRRQYQLAIPSGALTDGR